MIERKVLFFLIILLTNLKDRFNIKLRKKKGTKLWKD